MRLQAEKDAMDKIIEQIAHLHTAVVALKPSRQSIAAKRSLDTLLKQAREVRSKIDRIHP